MDFVYKDLAKTILFRVPKLVENVIIPSNVREIYGTGEKDNAFMDCKDTLRSFSFENAQNIIRISDFSFFSCKNLGEIDLSSCTNLIFIGAKAFQACNSAQTLLLPNSKLATIKDSAFAFCSSLKTIYIPATINSVGDSLFSYCSELTSVEFDPETKLTVLNRWAFNNCVKLTNFTVPKSFTSFSNTFGSCNSLTNFFVDERSNNFRSFDGVVYSFDNESLIYFPPGRTGNYTIREGTLNIEFCGFVSSKISYVNFASTLVKICSYAFSSSSIKRAEFPDSIQTFMDRAFEESSLEEVYFPKKVDVISDGCFYNCRSLTYVRLPSKFNYIGGGLFARCNEGLKLDFEKGSDFVVDDDKFVYNKAGNQINLYFGQASTITIKPQVTNIATMVFLDNTNINEVIFEGESQLQSIGERAFHGTNIANIVLPNSVTTIGRKAFCSCKSLLTAKLGTSLKSISERMFEGCTKLHKVELTATIEYNISPYAFYGCEQLSEIILTEGLTKISEFSFYSCRKITKLDIPKTIKVIESNAFYQSGLTSLTIHKDAQIDNLPSYFLGGCSDLVTLSLPDTVKTFGTYCLADTKITSFTIPSQLNTIESFCFKGCSELVNFTIPEASQLCTIEYGVFSECSNFERVETFSKSFHVITGALYNQEETKLIVVPPKLSIRFFTFPDKLETIGNSALLGCIYIQQIFIPTGSVQTIEKCAFENCTNLKIINFPVSVTNIGEDAFKGCNKLQCGLQIENESKAFREELVSKAKLPRVCLNDCARMCTCEQKVVTRIFSVFCSLILFFSV